MSRASHRTGLLAGLLILGLAGTGAARAQIGACPPPQKSAAGACVSACPAGYADQGRTCVYRNEAH